MIIEAFLIGTIVANCIGIIVVREHNKKVDRLIERTMVKEVKEKSHKETPKPSSSGHVIVEINGKRVVDLEGGKDF